MKQLNIREVRRSLTRLEDILGTEGEVTITRRGEAIARLTPVKRNLAIPSHRDLRGKMPRLRQRSQVLVRKDRDGR